MSSQTSSPKLVHIDDVKRVEYDDRWSKVLIGGSAVSTRRGFKLGEVEYHAEKFEDFEIVGDQKVLYVLSGEGEVMIRYVGRDVFYLVRPGTALYIPAFASHAVRCIGEAPIRLVYAHGAT